MGSWRSCLGARLRIFNAPREGPPTVDRVGTVAPVETGSATRVKVEIGDPDLRKGLRNVPRVEPQIRSECSKAVQAVIPFQGRKLLGLLCGLEPQHTHALLVWKPIMSGSPEFPFDSPPDQLAAASRLWNSQFWKLHRTALTAAWSKGNQGPK